MKAAKHILTSCFGRKKFTFASLCILFGLFIISTLATSLTLNTGRAEAAEVCRFSSLIGGLDRTEGDIAKSTVIGEELCIGPSFGPSSASGGSFFEFIVRFNGPVENANIHFKNDNGNSGSTGSNELSGNFRKVNSTTYVVEPRDKAGYMIPYNFQSSLRCNAATEKRAAITVTVEANGKNQEFKFNLCDSATYNREYSISRTAEQIPADGQQSSGKGRIIGEFTTTRWGATVSDPARNGRSNKRCVVEFILEKEGGQTLRGDANAPWYTLTNGNLEIPNLDPGKYNVIITYNDRLCMQQDSPGAQSAWTTDRLVIESRNIEVKAGEDANIKLTNPQPTNDPGAGEGGNVPADQPVCTTGNGLAGAIAWILCPLAALIANATSFIERNLILPYLTVSPFTTDANNPVYLLWQSVRNVANVLFIIAFFIVIFSQATSIGLSNYGIKRLLPRIALVAILTNLSYFIAAFLVDTFNVFGAGVGQLVMEALKQAKVGDQNYDPSSGQFWFLGGVALAAIIVKAGPVLGWLFGLIGLAFLIILAAVVVLVIRQMLIIAVVAASPLIMIGILLPNTEQKSAKVISLFFNLLAMYPLIVLVFASGKIFGALLGSPNYNLGGLDGGESSGIAEALRVIFQFLGNTLPLALLPFSLMAGGAIMRRVTSGVRRVAGRVGHGALSGIKGSRLGQFAQEKLAERRTRLRGTPPPSTGAAAYMPWNLKRRAGQGIRSSTLFNRATGGFGTYLDRENAAARKEMNDQASKFLGGDLPAAFALESANGNRGALQDIIKNKRYFARNPDGSLSTKPTQIDSSTTQRLQQFLGANNYKGAAGARAIAHTLADTNQLNKDKYERLSKLAGQDGTIARDDFVAEQNVYNDQKGFSNLAQAGWVRNQDGTERFEQYAEEFGMKSAAGVYASLRLRETKKQILADPTIRDQIKADATDTQNPEKRKSIMREVEQMKPDQVQNVFEAIKYNPFTKKTYTSVTDAAFLQELKDIRDEKARGSTPPPSTGRGGGATGGGSNPTNPPGPTGGGGGGNPPPPTMPPFPPTSPTPPPPAGSVRY